MTALIVFIDFDWIEPPDPKRRRDALSSKAYRGACTGALAARASELGWPQAENDGGELMWTFQDPGDIDRIAYVIALLRNQFNLSEDDVSVYSQDELDAM